MGLVNGVLVNSGWWIVDSEFIITPHLPHSHAPLPSDKIPHPLGILSKRVEQIGCHKNVFIG